VPLSFDYYRKYENPKPVAKPSKDHPLLYNLFGSIEDDESMIFTHDDMFDFLFAIAGRHQLPDEIRNELKTAKSFILLGFKFDKWYVKLILRLFNLHSGRFMRYAAEGKKNLHPSTKEWYEHLFKITFVENDLTAFVGELHKRCEKSGLLRKLGDAGAHASMSVQERVRHHIHHDEVEKAIALLTQFFEQANKEELLNDLSVLANSYRRLKRRMGTGTVSEADAELRTAQVVSGLLDLAEETVV
jgi:hypothetical protein